ncbi:apolipoprotein N-acyltransferase [uncultured Pseudokineococcus sp.]|uniref:apolipoprotein N-acyltransferase n=1 Tax=uncultured Pseudokineococcus sp. TaxID=1642928 RepID=UPI002633EE83|nr:apolipoprotein N-acyltransferase [uncultured Pseudokineococcus sp.]
MLLRPSPLARAATAALGGALVAVAFPEPGWWWLAAPGVGALVAAVAGARLRTAALLGLLHGLVLFVVLLRWTAEYVGPVAYALAVAEALFVALAGLLVALVLRAGRGGGRSGGRDAAGTPAHREVPPGAWTPPGAVTACLQAVGAGAVWTGVEALRARFPFGGFGWGRLAFSQADSPTVGLAALGGAPLVSFAVATTGAALALVLLHLAAAAGQHRLRREGAEPAVGPSSTAPRALARSTARVLPPLLLAALLAAGGALVPRPTAAEAGTLVVAAVQGDVPEPGLDFNAERRAVLDNHVRATEELADAVAAGRAPQPDVVVWPENASDIDPFANADAAARIEEAVRAIGAPVLVGTLVRGSRGTGLPADLEAGTGSTGDELQDDELRNVVVVWEPGEGPTQVYAKRHPVPFGEYVPHRDFFRLFSDKVDLVRADMVPGERPGLLDVAGARLGALICFEVVEDGLVDDVVRGGAELLVVPTNNATFGFTDESVQQLAISRVRAVEEGRAVVHASTVGVSAVIAPDGSTGRTTELFTPDVLVQEVPLRTSLTPAARAGAWPEVALTVLGALAALVGALGGRRTSAGRPDDDGDGAADDDPRGPGPGARQSRVPSAAGGAA